MVAEEHLAGVCAVGSEGKKIGSISHKTHRMERQRCTAREDLAHTSDSCHQHKLMAPSNTHAHSNLHTMLKPLRSTVNSSQHHRTHPFHAPRSPPVITDHISPPLHQRLSIPSHPTFHDLKPSSYPSVPISPPNPPFEPSKPSNPTHLPSKDSNKPPVRPFQLPEQPPVCAAPYRTHYRSR